MLDPSEHPPASAVVPPRRRPTAVIRPLSPRDAPRRKPRREFAVWSAFAVLIALAATIVTLQLADRSDDADLSSSMRPATPEEIAAAVTPVEATADPGVELPPVDGPAAPETPSATDPPAAPDTAEPDLPQYRAPQVADEPVVAVAEALGPSVVLVEVQAPVGFGLGSGIIWDAENGYIVTNQHVVEDSETVSVILSDGSRLDGEVIGGSAGHDVAVVQVDPSAAEELPEAVFAPVSSVRVGQLAVAIGSPLGLTGTVTAGIVSAVRIQVQGGADPDSPVPVEMIQTDAAINRGNSGGALADWQGRVIGMNTMIQTTSGANIGLGFAVPSDTVELIATRIVNGESLELGYLGISGQAGEDGAPGVVIVEVFAGSPADEAGLMVGDVIVSLDSEPMQDIVELSAAIKLRRPGDTISMTVRRDADLYVATAILDALG